MSGYSHNCQRKTCVGFEAKLGLQPEPEGNPQRVNAEIVEGQVDLKVAGTPKRKGREGKQEMDSKMSLSDARRMT